MSGCLRHMRTTQERRKACAAEQMARAAEEPAPRARRTHRTLPQLWDDIFRKTWRTWKKYRKTQYKPVSDGAE